MYKDGIVVSTKDNMARVAVMRMSGCGGSCDSCGGCESEEVFVDLPNHVKAKVGDKVKIRANSNMLFKLSFLVYIIPIVLLVLAISLSHSYFMNIGNENYELISFAFGLLAFVLSSFILRKIDKKNAKAKEELMVIEEITGNLAD